MLQKHCLSTEERILILNTPFSLRERNFYIDLFRIPEVLSRLRQYREILSENNLDIPIWVYCLTQDIKSLKGSPRAAVLNLIVSLGLFDRYLAKQGWPRYLIGYHPLLALITGEITFEQSALDLTKGRADYEESLFLYKISSYVNSKTNTSYLTSLKKLRSCQSLEKIMNYLKNHHEAKISPTEQIVQFLGPNRQDLKQRIESFELYVQDFLEADEGLRWLWPIWKKTQIHASKQNFTGFERNC